MGKPLGVNKLDRIYKALVAPTSAAGFAAVCTTGSLAIRLIIEFEVLVDASAQLHVSIVELHTLIRRYGDAVAEREADQ